MKKTVSCILSALLLCSSFPSGAFAQNFKFINDDNVAASDQTNYVNKDVFMKSKFMDQKTSLSKEHAALVSKCKTLLATKKPAKTRTEKDLRPVRYINEASNQTCFVKPLTGKSGNSLTDAKGNTIYTAIFYSAQVDPLGFDEVQITYNGKPAAASMIAIGRDLLNFKEIGGKTPEKIRADLVKAETILVKLIDTFHGEAAVDKLALIGAMLVNSSEDKDKKAGIRIVKYLAALGNGTGNFSYSIDSLTTPYASIIQKGRKDQYLRMRAMLALGLIGASLGPDTELSKSLVNYLASKAESSPDSENVSIGDTAFHPAEKQTASSESFNVRVAAIAALATIGSRYALNAIEGVSHEIDLQFYTRGYGSDEDIYYRCTPDSKDGDATYNAAANDGGIQCVAAMALDDFLIAQNKPTAEQKSEALFLLKGMARIDVCGTYYADKVLKNSVIHALGWLYHRDAVPAKCLEPIANAVGAWKGNRLKLPCDIVNKAREINGMDADCETDILYHEGLVIVQNIAVGMLMGVAIEAGIGAIVSRLSGAAASCRALMFGIRALKAGETVYKGYDKFMEVQDYAELAMVVGELSFGGEKESKKH